MMQSRSRTLEFRALEKEDAVAMQELEARCFSLPWTEEQCRTAFGQSAFAAFGLWDGRELVAYVSLYHSLDELEILNLAVSPERRRQGLGRHLLQMALQAAHKMGIRKSLLEVRESNAPAIGLYEGAGFRLAGRRRAYYHDPDEDALIYTRPASSDEA